MRFLLVSLAAWLMVLPAVSQKYPVKFGDVSMEQLKMTKYPKDSGAAAVILADFGESKIEYEQSLGFKINFERITRVKILTKEGLEWSNFSIPLYHDKGSDEKISGLKAVTYNLENGKIVETKVKSDGIFKEKADENLDYMKVTLPNVREGSVIELTYRINSDFLFNFWDWEFQRTIPAVFSEYRAAIPEYFFYDKYMQGYLPLTVNEETQREGSITFTSIDRGDNRGVRANGTLESEKITYIEKRFRWAVNDVPAFKSEPFITTSKDYVSKMNFELSHIAYPNQAIKYYRGTWEKLNEEFLDNESFGQPLRGSGFLNRIVEEITVGKLTPAEKLNAIYSYVKQNIEWNGTSSKYLSKDLRKVIDEKKGSAADINLLLAAMLLKADFVASPVIISTRDHGFVRVEMPISSQFNYVIVAVKMDDKTILMDATDRSLPMAVLPERCLNDKGYLISKDKAGWISLTPASKSRTATTVELALDMDGKLKGKIRVSRDGYDAQQVRKKYFAKGESDYCKDLASSYSWELSKSEFENMKQLSESAKEVHELTIAEHTQSAGSMIYLNPILVHRLEENPFKSESRQYPVNFGSPSERLFIGKITIPDGLVVEELPKPKVIALPGNAARYVYSLSQIANYISITSQLSINKGLFTQEEYPNLREFYNQVVAKQAEQIVLKRK